MNAILPSLNAENLPPELRNLLNSPDGPAFEQALDVMVRDREKRLFRALGQLARDLHGAMSRLGGELANEGIPGSVADARKHLNDVLEMSAQAAHRSIDFAERMRPAADRPTWASDRARASIRQKAPSSAIMTWLPLRPSATRPTS